MDFKPDSKEQPSLAVGTDGKDAASPGYVPGMRACTPEYPGEEVVGPWAGGTELRLLIDESGKVEKTEIIRPLGLGIDECVAMNFRNGHFQPDTIIAARARHYLVVRHHLSPNAVQVETGRAPEPVPTDLFTPNAMHGFKPEGPSESPHQDENLIFHVGGNVRPPIATYTPAPELTGEARRAGVKATVVLNVVIGRDGRVSRTKILKSAGMGLDESTINMVKTLALPTGNARRPTRCRRDEHRGQSRTALKQCTKAAVPP